MSFMLHNSNKRALKSHPNSVCLNAPESFLYSPYCCSRAIITERTLSSNPECESRGFRKLREVRNMPLLLPDSMELVLNTEHLFQTQGFNRVPCYNQEQELRQCSSHSLRPGLGSWRGGGESELKEWQAGRPSSCSSSIFYVYSTLSKWPSAWVSLSISYLTEISASREGFLSISVYATPSTEPGTQ